MKKVFCGLFLAGSILTSPVQAEFRTWTNLAGTKIDAELVKSDGTDVTMKLRNGKLTTFPLAKLSLPDQDLINAGPTEAAPAAATTAAAPAKGTVGADRKAKWVTKMSKAQEEAQATGLPILVLFTGTSWCPYCIKLENEVFAKPDFKTFANQNLVLLMLDFGPGGAPNNRKDGEMAKEFGVTGYPAYFLTDASGKKLAQGGYHGGINPSGFADWVKKSAPKK